MNVRKAICTLLYSTTTTTVLGDTYQVTLLLNFCGIFGLIAGMSTPIVRYKIQRAL